MERWWEKPVSKGVGSLAIALSVTFGPMAADEIRARRSATPIAIVASALDTLPFSFRASSTITPPPAESLTVTVHVMNRGSGTVRATVSEHCPVLFHLREAGGTANPARWSGPSRSCPVLGRQIALGPSQVQHLRAAVAVRDVVGDSLPDARYIVTAFITINGETTSQPAGEVTLRRR